MNLKRTLNMSVAILYGRFSPRRNAKECESIETQFDRLRSWCAAVGREIGAEYSDREASGKTMVGRPALAEALEHVCRVRGVLAVYKLDRLARSTRDALAISERLESAGADLASLRESFDTSTSTGRFFFSVMAAMAQLEREQAAERTSDAMRRHQAAGRRMSAQPPWGTMIDPEDPKRLVMCEEELEIAERIRSLAAQGLSLRAIARRLEWEGVERRGKREWHHELVGRILKDAR
jgi:site-specific DNA recombinase